MKITLVTSKTCHCTDIEHALRVLGFRYERCDIEDAPALVQQFGVRHCPTLIVNERRVIPIDDGNVGQLRQLLTID